MCLIYQGKTPPSDKPFTAYKVFVLFSQQLCSPWHYGTPGGQISRAGVYDALVRDEVVGTSAGAQGRFFSWDEIPVGVGVDISGFHCILSRDGAEAYAKHLVYLGFKLTQLSVVEVQVDPADVLAVGTTSAFQDGVKSKDLELPTVVVKRIAVSDESFRKALCA